MVLNDKLIKKCKSYERFEHTYDEIKTSTKKMKKLNIGCGTDIRKGWINLDNHKQHGADVVFDLKEVYKRKKMPFKDNSMEQIYCSHVLEHLSYTTPIIDEFLRIIKEDGLIEIKVPRDTITWNAIDHSKGFTMSAFKGYKDRFNNVDGLKNVEIVKMEYYPPRYTGQNLFFRAYLNLSSKIQNILRREIMEFTFMKLMLPTGNIRVIYKKKKLK